MGIFSFSLKRKPLTQLTYFLYIIINSPGMLLNNHKRHTSSITFSQQLAYLKHHKQPTTASKNAEYFQTVTSVLDLLLHAYPAITNQLMTLKTAMKKWYEHLQAESIAKSRQLMDMRQNLVVYVSKEIGVTLEEIGYYVKYFTDNYRDEDMRRLYVQYLNAIKKLEWNHDPRLPLCKHQSVQTEDEQPSYDLPTVKSISAPPGRISEATIDSPHAKYKDFDIHKYIKAKEESLELEKRASQMIARLSDLEAENKGLKREIQRLHDEYRECMMDKEKELNQIAKLKQLLSSLKQQEQERRQRQLEKIDRFNVAQRKFDQSQSIKNAIHQNLENAQMQIMQQQKIKDHEEDEQILNQNYHTALNQSDDKYKTVKKQGKNNEFPDVGSELRMLLIQAITIQSYINGPSFEQ